MATSLRFEAYQYASELLGISSGSFWSKLNQQLLSNQLTQVTLIMIQWIMLQ